MLSNIYMPLLQFLDVAFLFKCDFGSFSGNSYPLHKELGNVFLDLIFMIERCFSDIAAPGTER